MMEEQQYYLDQDGVAYTIVESQQVGNIVCQKAWHGCSGLTCQQNQMRNCQTHSPTSTNVVEFDMKMTLRTTQTQQ